VDAKVYAKAPARVETNSAITVLKASDADDLDIVTSTPKVCIALTTSVVFTGTGRCTVRILDEDTRRVVRSFSTTVSAAESTAGTALTTDKPIMFGQVQTALSAAARAQVKELAAAATGAGRILILGHSASLYGNEVSNRFISLQRAAAVKRALIAAGVKNPISIVAMGSKDMVSTGKTEAQQALNRRVEVFIFPVAN
jgi:outer membrane protein OmpA-like peptidoglycan-associated protein